MKLFVTLLVVPIGMIPFTGSFRTARADDVAVPSAVVVKDESITTGPNRPLLRSGIWILGLSYVPAVIVAAESNRAGDKHLYIPVAGPWMDLASRSNCPMNVTCSNETTNKVLIVADGVFQALGAFNILGAFISPEKRTVSVGLSEHSSSKVSNLSIHVFPTRVSMGTYGLAAVCSF